MDRKLFTVTEANRAIPRIARLIEELQQGYRWLKVNRQEVTFTLAEYNILNEGPVKPDYFHALVRARRDLKEIQDVGAQVKDIGSGLVDFPARLYGREVLLCWRLGEAEIGFWHDLEAGFAGRQPLPASPGGSGSEEEGN